MDGKKLNKTQILTLIGLGIVAVGILLTYIPWGKKDAKPTFVEEQQKVVTQPVSTKELTYEEALEVRLATILTALEGAGETQVMVTTSTTNELVLAEEVVECIQDTDETDKSGRTKSNTKQDTTTKIVMQKGDTPFVVKENRPKIEGVIVFAEGADDSVVKEAIMKSVSSVLNVPVHKIAVFKLAKN